MTPAEQDRFRRDGFVVLEERIEPILLERLLLGLDAMLRDADHADGDDVRFDLADDGAGGSRVCRRINNPHCWDEAFHELLHLPRILDIVSQLIGEDIVYEDMPLNLKPPGPLGAIGWHQDWAFMPRTNDNAITVTVHLIETTAQNGPIAFVPATHKAPYVFDHHRDGRFAGRIDPSDPLVPWGDEVIVKAHAGAICIHHARTVHGSRPNLGDKLRPVQAIGFHAADAWPLIGINADTEQTVSEKLLRGTMRQPVFVANPVRLPFPPPPDRGSIFRVQSSGGPLFTNSGDQSPIS